MPQHPHKAVELLARIYDHVEHKYQRGVTMLTLGWSGGLLATLTAANPFLNRNFKLFRKNPLQNSGFPVK